MTLPDIKQPLVSVIMPTYNHAKFIGEAIESVLNQTYKNIELIIIDNYSEDNTEKIIRSFNDHRIRYMKFRNNRVIAASRNFGMKMAQGKYVAFLDSDDLWLLEKIEKQVYILEKYTEVALVYTNIEIFSESSHFTLFRWGYSGNIFNQLIIKNFIPCLTVMIRKDILENIGSFDESYDLRYAEDYELWMRIAYTYKVYCIPKVLARYRVHPESTLSGNNIQTHEKSLTALMFLSKKIDIPPKLIKKSLKTKYARIAIGYFEKGFIEKFLLNRDESFKYGIDLNLLILNFLYLFFGPKKSLKIVKYPLRIRRKILYGSTL